MAVDREDYHLERPAEYLVVEGYRHWTEGVLNSSSKPWRRGEALFSGRLGVIDGPQLFDLLFSFVATLGLCAVCPLKTQRVGSIGLCRDEVLVLGLISAYQHGNDDAAELCLQTLACEEGCERVAQAAATLACNLKASNLRLAPISAGVLSKIILDYMPSKTFH